MYRKWRFLFMTYTIGSRHPRQIMLALHNLFIDAIVVVDSNLNAATYCGIIMLKNMAFSLHGAIPSNLLGFAAFQDNKIITR